MIAQTSPPTLPAPQRRHALAKVRSLPTVILVLSLVIHVLIGFFTLSKGHSGASGQDFFIMYTGTRQAARGLNPYTASYLKEALAARARDSGDSTVLEGGFFLSAAILAAVSSVLFSAVFNRIFLLVSV